MARARLFRTSRAEGGEESGRELATLAAPALAAPALLTAAASSQLLAAASFALAPALDDTGFYATGREGGGAGRG